jgi:glyoxylase-like metal-dependent hydrolase (beta-lactamase superfamily II)
MAPPELLSKFFMAKPSIVDKDSLKLLPEGVKPIDLPGHYFGMCGYLTNDRVFFAADALFSQQVLEKYHISFIHDVASFLSTLEMLPSIDCDVYVPSHAEPTNDIRPLAQKNRDKVNEIAALVYDSCKQPSSPDDVLKMMFDYYGLQMDMGQYALAGSTVKSFITYLRSQGRLEASFEGNRLLYSSI